jgi:hypothetical protein
LPDHPRRRDDDDPLAAATGCLNGLIIVACLTGAIFLLVIALTR